MKTLQRIRIKPTIRNTSVYLSLGLGACVYYMMDSYSAQKIQSDFAPKAENVKHLRDGEQTSMLASQPETKQTALLQELRERTQDVLSVRRSRG